MYEEDNRFTLPEDKKLAIWRYTDLPKFIRMLETKSLYFCRSDKFEDKFEGFLTEETIKAITNYFEKNRVSEASTTGYIKYFSNVRTEMFLNCWQLNALDSNIMWKAYSGIKNGIAIKSTVERMIRYLKNAKESLHLGTVTYIDYEKDLQPAHYAFYPVLYKRKFFELENEIRAVYWAKEEANSIINADFEKIIGIEVKSNLDDLIESIWISPYSDPFFPEICKDILSKYGIKKDLCISKI